MGMFLLAWRRKRCGMGYGLFGSTYGWGGSMVMTEPDARMAVSYVTARGLAVSQISVS
jgi:hypothetical protein